MKGREKERKLVSRFIFKRPQNRKLTLMTASKTPFELERKRYCKKSQLASRIQLHEMFQIDIQLVRFGSKAMNLRKIGVHQVEKETFDSNNEDICM